MGPLRIGVTGLGVISALGPDKGAFWQALRAGQSAIRPLEGIDAEGLRFQNGAQAIDFDPNCHFDQPTILMLDRFAQFAAVAAREAIADAGLAREEIRGGRTAVVTGACVAGQSAVDDVHRELYLKKRNRVHPFSVPRFMINAGASQISLEWGITGPVFTVSTACASANHAIGLALGMLRSGMIDRAIAGGSDAPFVFGHLKGWEALRVVAPDTCRPFCADRKGMILGEGGAMLILEPVETALARGARIYGELAGAGMSADAHHMMQPSVEGPARAMQAALEDGGIPPEAVGYLNAHGTGTIANDVTETAAVRQLFGSHADRLAISSTKSMHGHTLGAAGALEAAATLLALHHGILPPTANFTRSDPACDLDVIPNAPRPCEVECALSNSFGFGGLNAVLAFRRWGA